VVRSVVVLTAADGPAHRAERVQVGRAHDRHGRRARHPGETRAQRAVRRGPFPTVREVGRRLSGVSRLLW